MRSLAHKVLNIVANHPGVQIAGILSLLPELDNRIGAIKVGEILTDFVQKGIIRETKRMGIHYRLIEKR